MLFVSVAGFCFVEDGLRLGLRFPQFVVVNSPVTLFLRFIAILGALLVVRPIDLAGALVILDELADAVSCVVLVLSVTHLSVRVCHGASAPHVHEIVEIRLHDTHEHLERANPVSIKGGRLSNAGFRVLVNVPLDYAVLGEVIHFTDNQSVCHL